MEEEQSETKKKECVSVRYRTAVTENLKRFGKPRLEAANVDREKLRYSRTSYGMKNKMLENPKQNQQMLETGLAAYRKPEIKLMPQADNLNM